MPLTLDDNPASYQIRSYKPGQIQINDELIEKSLVISASQLITNWPPQSAQELKAEHLDLMLELKPAILLIGTGDKLIFPPLEVYGKLLNHGIGVEVMNTKSACRTFNVLTAEGR